MDEVTSIKRQVENYQRRLNVLKEQQALKGSNTPPEVVLEIEDIEAKITNLQSELQQFPGGSKPVAVSPTSSSPERKDAPGPLSISNIFAGIIITVVGGLVLTGIVSFGPNLFGSFFGPPTPTITPTATETPVEEIVLINTDTPTPTWTPTVADVSTPTETWTPTFEPTIIETATPTPTHSPSSTPTPTPSCPTSPVYFQDIWRSLEDELGCPTSNSTSDFTYQMFDGGLFAWRKFPDPTIYTFLNNGRWESFPDPGTSDPCPEATGLNLNFGFRTVWCENKNIRDEVRMPRSGELDGKNNQIQNFENGIIMTVGTGDVFVLYSDSQWQAF
ncbi:MAG: FlxA-like family protein [Anaerolineales bacterium]|nr:FlxA-like family protein [Anaerolineales bacterium]